MIFRLILEAEVFKEVLQIIFNYATTIFFRFPQFKVRKDVLKHAHTTQNLLEKFESWITYLEYYLVVQKVRTKIFILQYKT